MKTCTESSLEGNANDAFEVVPPSVLFECRMTAHQYRETPINPGSGWATQKVEAFEMLEPYDGKLSCTVLREGSGRKPRSLLGPIKKRYENWQILLA